MAEYIKKEDAIAHPFANGNYDKKHADMQFILGHESYKEWLEDIPAADVRENVRGKWIKDEYGYLVCSECENEMPTLWSQGRIPKWTVRYCYYCGAEMEVQDDTD